MLVLPLALTLMSPPLRTGATVPRAFVWNKDGCNGLNRTPRLQWDAPPASTNSFDLVVVDHDAPKPGGWIHWKVMHLSASAREVSERVPRGAVVLRNDFGTLGWGGPCPPPGPMHHYTFLLRALDAQGRVVASATLIPVYKR